MLFSLHTTDLQFLVAPGLIPHVVTWLLISHLAFCFYSLSPVPSTYRIFDTAASWILNPHNNLPILNPSAFYFHSLFYGGIKGQAVLFCPWWKRKGTITLWGCHHVGWRGAVISILQSRTRAKVSKVRAADSLFDPNVYGGIFKCAFMTRLLLLRHLDGFANTTPGRYLCP